MSKDKLDLYRYDKKYYQEQVSLSEGGFEDALKEWAREWVSEFKTAGLIMSTEIGFKLFLEAVNENSNITTEMRRDFLREVIDLDTLECCVPSCRRIFQDQSLSGFLKVFDEIERELRVPQESVIPSEECVFEDDFVLVERIGSKDGLKEGRGSSS